MIKTILFDLDGTLLPMNQELFVKSYLTKLAAKVTPLGYEPKTFMGVMWAGVEAMIKNDGSVTNETAFWNCFTDILGKKCLNDILVFDDFYKNEFQTVAADCGYTPKAKELIDFLKAKGYRLVLATNPFFPAIATESRIRWAGLSPEDFEYYTTYENSSYCKPNPKYYLEILEKIDCKPEECMMVGNDVGEDMITETLGMKVFLLADCLINKQNVDITQYPNGSFDDLKHIFS